MRIALIVPAIGDDAIVATPAINTFVQYVGAQVDVHVFTMRYPVGRQPVPLFGGTVHPVPAEDMRLRHLARWTIGSMCAEHRNAPFDLVHGLWLFEPGALAVLAARILRIPSIVSIGGAEVAAFPDINYGGLLSRRQRVIQRRTLRSAGIVTGGSRYINDLAAAFVQRSNGYALAPLPVDTALFQPGSSDLLNDIERPRLLHAASLIPVKDQMTLLNAFAKVRQSIPGAMLDIAGEDPFGRRQELERLAASLGIGEATHFLGAVPHRDMAGRYRLSDLLVLNSRHESQGMVVLEAAACGVPTAGTDVGVVRDLAPRSAVAVPVGDAGALAASIIALLEDPVRLRAMGRSARLRVEREFAPEPASRRFLDLYNDARAERHQ